MGAALNKDLIFFSPQQFPNKLLSTSEASPQWADSPSPAQSCADDLSYICKSLEKMRKEMQQVKLRVFLPYPICSSHSLWAFVCNVELARPVNSVPNIPGIPGPPVGGASSGSSSPSAYGLHSETKMVR